MKKYKVKYNFEDSSHDNFTFVHAISYDRAMEIAERNLETPDSKVYVTEVQRVK